MTCSVGVCQCQGIKQPAVPLKTITDGPLEGSPLSTAMVVHEGSPAIGANLFSDNLWSTPISSAWVMNRHMTAAATNLIASFPRININPVYPGDGSVGTRHFGAAWRHYPSQFHTALPLAPIGFGTAARCEASIRRSVLKRHTGTALTFSSAG